MRSLLAALAVVACSSGCSSSWPTAEIAAQRCSDYDAARRREWAGRLRIAEVEERRAEQAQKSKNEIDRILAKGDLEMARIHIREAREMTDYAPAAFMAKCVPLASEAIAPCAAEFSPGTDSAERCIDRRIENAKLGKAALP